MAKKTKRQILEDNANILREAFVNSMYNLLQVEDHYGSKMTEKETELVNMAHKCVWSCTYMAAMNLWNDTKANPELYSKREIEVVNGIALEIGDGWMSEDGRNDAYSWYIAVFYRLTDHPDYDPKYFEDEFEAHPEYFEDQLEAL